MQIRKIEPKDITACAVIVEQAYSQPPYNEIFKESTALQYIQGKFKNGYEDSFVAVEDSGNVVGFVFLTLSTWATGPQAILEEIVVDPQYQGSGIGKLLMEHINTYLSSRGVKSALLWVKKDDRLLNFYKQQGYFVADDFVVMFKDF